MNLQNTFFELSQYFLYSMNIEESKKVFLLTFQQVMKN